jgi:N-acyl-phosphatidylethanolamine-hydrolysing phospholipase D
MNIPASRQQSASLRRLPQIPDNVENGAFMGFPGGKKFILSVFMIPILVVCTILVFSGSTSYGEMEGKPEHHTQKGFQNFPVTRPTSSPSTRFILRRIWSSFNLPKVPDTHYLSQKEALRQFEFLGEQNTITWIGHATFLIRLNGKNILTDPFFSEYAGPFSTGPRRYVKPGISINNLPPINMILVSHNHYDHLDSEAVESFPGKKNIHIFAPLGLGSFFKKRGYRHIHELDWHEKVSMGDMNVISLPAVHYSGRGMFDKNKSLWCSWSINTSAGNFFFMGDTAYSSVLFKEIGEQFRSFDFVMLPIGTYGNRKKYGANNHITPEEAVKIGIDLNANVTIGMHWGTIELADEPPWEPPVRFRNAATQKQIAPQRIWLMKIGETRLLPNPG